MITKETIVIDTILKGVALNKNNEVDYTTNISIELDKDIDFEYAIVNEGTEISAVFTSAHKSVNLNFKSFDGISQKKVILLKSTERANATVTIDLDRILSTSSTTPQLNNETMGPTGKVLLRETDPEQKWYQNPVYLGIVAVVVIFGGMYLFSKNKKNSNLTFLD